MSIRLRPITIYGLKFVQPTRCWMQTSLYPDGNRPPSWQFATGMRNWFPLTSAGIRNASSHVLKCAGRYEVYYGVLPRVGQNGKSIDVPASKWLWCDVDGGSGGVTGSRELLKSAETRGLPSPSMAVVSGNGLHVYWQLNECVSLVDDDARRRFKELLTRLCDLN